MEGMRGMIPMTNSLFDFRLSPIEIYEGLLGQRQRSEDHWQSIYSLYGTGGKDMVEVTRAWSTCLVSAHDIQS